MTFSNYKFYFTDIFLNNNNDNHKNVKYNQKKYFKDLILVLEF